MQDNYSDETKRAAAVKTGGADVPAAAAETAVPAASNTDTPTMPPGHKLVDPFTCGNIVDEHDDKRCDWRPVVYLPLRSVTDPDDVVCPRSKAAAPSSTATTLGSTRNMDG